MMSLFDSKRLEKEYLMKRMEDKMYSPRVGDVFVYKKKKYVMIDVDMSLERNLDSINYDRVYTVIPYYDIANLEPDESINLLNIKDISQGIIVNKTNVLPFQETDHIPFEIGRMSITYARRKKEITRIDYV